MRTTQAAFSVTCRGCGGTLELVDDGSLGIADANGAHVRCGRCGTHNWATQPSDPAAARSMGGAD